MKKLEDIPKKQIFTVPDDYFNKLPGAIQAKIEQGRKEESHVLRYALRYAVPVIVLGVVAVLWLNKPSFPGSDTEKILASVQTEDLVSYLSESSMTTEELINQVTFQQDDIDGIEETVYDLNLGDNDLENIMDDIDLNL
jgi:hypothetical protein